ncbi:MAG: class I SAM-dependent methyltransferase [Solirubrobacteraceae bacterium]
MAPAPVHRLRAAALRRPEPPGVGRRPGLVRPDRPARASRRDQRAGDESRHRAGRRQRHPPVVQLGHYYGYSALLLGFTLRAMGARPGLFTIDIDPAACEFTRRWLAHAGLCDDVVVVREGDSADPRLADDAAAVLGGPPELVLVDSSHAYSHTLAELDLWTPRLPVGGLVLLHDASEFATAFDPTGEGGVRRAIAEWLPDHPTMAGLTLNGHVAPGADGDALVYKDACGLGVLQRVR